jgi:hypothetical protein
MTDFGRFRLSYEPGKSDPHLGILDHSVEMTISGEADLNNLLSFFTCFLQASGYIVDGKIQIVNDRDIDPWGNYSQCNGSQATDFIAISAAGDLLNFGTK